MRSERELQATIRKNLICDKLFIIKVRYIQYLNRCFIILIKKKDASSKLSHVQRLRDPILANEGLLVPQKERPTRCRARLPRGS